ncbi:hypothetical protein GIB67_023534 [Kingdonia uniflora]|uniref:Cytochrome P450 n=1 Tax=Kingdonia uniflora TaxID=39325 RepID=A0A7J7PA61_9MAGN|nr:hypothetical protein GIB67_023534 [Kingdonia uniflora]
MGILHYVLLCFFTLILIIKLCSEYIKYRKFPPSPFALPIVGHLHLVKKKPLYKSLQTLAEKYGPIIFLKFGSRPVLVVSSTSAVEECFIKNDIIFANRPPHSVAGDHLSYNYSVLGWVPCGHQWRNLHSISAIKAFSSNSLQMPAYICDEEVRFVIRGLFETRTPQKVDLKTMLSELTFNMIMRGIAGKRCFESGMGKEEKKRVLRYLKETFVPVMTMEFGDFFPNLRRVCFRGVDYRMEKLRKERKIFNQGLIEECRLTKLESSPVAGKKCMISNLLSLQDSDPKQYTDDTIQGLISTMLSAGTETTALTMEWAMSLLVNHPEVLWKAHSEIEKIIQQGRLLDESDILKLPYLNCIINETLRLYPVAPLLVPHFSSKECTVGGYTVPPETMLLGNAWAIHRDPKLWVDPAKFMPERFEGGEIEKVDALKFIPFGIGRLSCPGSVLAMRMIGLALGTLIQCFEWERIGSDPKPLVMDPIVELDNNNGINIDFDGDDMEMEEIDGPL